MVSAISFGRLLRRVAVAVNREGAVALEERSVTLPSVRAWRRCVGSCAVIDFMETEGESPSRGSRPCTSEARSRSSGVTPAAERL